MLTDDDLLDFDRDRLSDGDTVDPPALLDRHGDVYRAQLIAARWVSGWGDRRDAQEPMVPSEGTYDDGYTQALREIAAHLRQGDFVAGGVLYEEEMRGSA